MGGCASSQDVADINGQRRLSSMPPSSVMPTMGDMYEEGESYTSPSANKAEDSTRTPAKVKRGESRIGRFTRGFSRALTVKILGEKPKHIKLTKEPTFKLLNSKQAELKQQRIQRRGMSETFSMELNKLFEKLDINKDGSLQKSEARAYLAALDSSFGHLKKSQQHEQLQEFLDSFGANENEEITLSMWRRKAVETFGVESNDPEEWEEMQKEAIAYTRNIIRSIEILNK